MKFSYLFYCVLALSAGAHGIFGQSVEGTTPATGAGASSPQPDLPGISPEAMLEVYGWFLGEQMQVFAFGMSDGEIAALNRGITMAARGVQPNVDFERVGPSIQEFLTTRPEEVQARRLAESREEETALFAKLEASPAAKKTDSGLRYEIIESGSEDGVPSLSDTVLVHYTGTFVDGTVFDSSHERGEPTEFKLNGVIEGWQEGLRLIGPGGIIKLYVPGDLAYGDTGNRNIPPGKPLLFEVELIEVKSEEAELDSSEGGAGQP